MDLKRFGELVNGARQRAKLTQQGLADEISSKLGLLVSQQSVANWCRGKNLPGDRATLLTLCQALYEADGLTSLEEINEVLLTADAGALHQRELEERFFMFVGTQNVLSSRDDGAFSRQNDGLRKDVLKALNYYYELEKLRESPLAELAASGVPIEATRGILASHTTGLAVRRLLDGAMEQLKKRLPEAVKLLDERFRQEVSISTMSEREHLSRAALHKHMNRATTALTTTIVEMAAQKASERAEKVYRQTEALPSHFRGQQLVGFESYLTQMRETFRTGMTNLGLVVVTGLGGIGKTSLTCAALEQWLSQEMPPLERVLWATVNNKIMEPTSEQRNLALEQVLWQLGEQLELPIAAIPNNKQRLRAIAKSLLDYSEPFVVVLDNVETPAEAQLALSVAEPLLSLAQVVVTSRRDIHHNRVRTRVRLQELSEEHALELLRLEANRYGLTPTDNDARQLYQHIGGHPLALKLVAGQLSLLPLKQVLSALHLNSPLADELYTHVYETSWNLLSDLSKEVLVGLMVLPVSGGDWEELRFFAQTEDDTALWPVIEQLSKLNLLQISVSRQGIHTYSLHRLTYSFLEHKAGLAE